MNYSFTRINPNVISGNNLIIETNYVKKKFPTKTIHFPDIIVNRGDFITIYGKSGAGKSTFCQIIVNFMQYDEGKININGINNNSQNVFEFIHYISQTPDHNLIGPTCIDDLKLWTMKTDEQINFMATLKEFNLLEQISVPIWKLSFGQKKALTFSALKISEKSIWLIDEPFTGLDSDMMDILKNCFIEFLQNNGTIIVTTHMESKILPEIIGNKYYEL